MDFRINSSEVILTSGLFSYTLLLYMRNDGHYVRRDEFTTSELRGKKCQFQGV